MITGYTYTVFEFVEYSRSLSVLSISLLRYISYIYLPMLLLSISSILVFLNLVACAATLCYCMKDAMPPDTPSCSIVIDINAELSFVR